jgi:hypothetical protein
MRIFRFVALASTLAMLTVGAHAQYNTLFATVNYTGLHASNVNEVDTNGTVVDTAYPISLDKAGFAVGGDWEVYGEDAHNLGIDTRMTIDPGIYQFLGGVRLGVHKHKSRIHPYVIFDVGFSFIKQTENISTVITAPFPDPGTTSMPFPNDSLRGVVAAFGGVDTAIRDVFGWRVEAGGGYTSSASLALTSSPGGGFFTLNTGPVFRF